MNEEMTLLDRAHLIVADRVEKMIAEGTADQIALKFQEKGIKAVCHSPTRCAIAVYLQQELDAELGVHLNLLVDVPGGAEMDIIMVCEVEPVEYTTERGQWPRRDSRAVWFTKGILGKFADNFDYKRYPELVLGEES